MKKLICLIAALCLVFSMAGCNSSEPNQTEGTTTGVQQTPVVTDGFTFTHNGTKIAMKAEAAPILEVLGEPISYTEEASCAFTGLDKTYFFGSFYLTTFPVEDKDYVYGIWFADDSVTTEEGLYIGASQQEVDSLYGEEHYNGTNAYILTKGETKLTVIMKDGFVSSIQYDALFD